MTKTKTRWLPTLAVVGLLLACGGPSTSTPAGAAIDIPFGVVEDLSGSNAAIRSFIDAFQPSPVAAIVAEAT